MTTTHGRTPAQLHMIWPAHVRPTPEDLAPATGYAKRPATRQDIPSFVTLMSAVELAATIYLQTDDHRLPAIKTYLSLGFVPHLYQPDMPARWRRVCDRLTWPYTPASWPRQTHVTAE